LESADPVCENNQFLAFVRRKGPVVTDHVADSARLNGIKAAAVDGDDIVLRSPPGTQLQE
jgi:hypothetical protein